MIVYFQPDENAIDSPCCGGSLDFHRKKCFSGPYNMTKSLLHSASIPPQIPPSQTKSDARSKPSQKRSVLVVDDERVIADTIVAILNQSGFSATAAYNGSAAIDQARLSHPDIVISDVMMPVLDGIESSIAIRDFCPDARIVLFSGHATTTELLASARSRGHEFEVLAKPLHPSKLIEYLQSHD
jgi:CheY-like chemotaxis protein